MLGRDFPHPSRPALRSKVYRVFPGGVKRPGRGVYHPPHLEPSLKKEHIGNSTPSQGIRGLL